MNVPGGPAREIVGGIVFAMAAGNVFVYTIKTFKATYTLAPLATWQLGAGEKATPEGKTNGPKPKGESVWEALKGTFGLDELFLKLP